MISITSNTGRKISKSMQETASKRRESNSQYDSSRIINALKIAAVRHNNSIEEVAKKLDISPSYYRALLAGTKPFACVDRTVLKNAAVYLDLPVAQAFLLAGTLEPEDFYYKDSLGSELSNCHRSMLEHPMWAGHAPTTAEWDEMDTKTKLFVAMLYEKATNTDFLKNTSVPAIDV